MPTTFAEALLPIAKRMPAAPREIEILRVSAELDGNDAAQSTHNARKAVLEWAKRRAGGPLPQAAWEMQEFDLPAGGRNSAAVRIVDEERDLWALRAEDPDKTIAGRTWTTEVVIGGRQGERVKFSLRLLVNTTETNFSIEHAVPGFVRRLAGDKSLIRGARTLVDKEKACITDNDVEDLCDHLEDPQRKLPVIVVTLPEDGSAKPLIDSADVASAIAGIARVVIVPAALTRVITNRFGKFRSVFNGGVRAYLPLFNKWDDPFRHRLFVPDVLREEGRAKACEVWLKRLAADNSLSSFRLGKDVLEFGALKSASRKLLLSGLKTSQAPDSDKILALERYVASLETELAAKQKEADEYFALASAEEERARAAEQENAAKIYELRRLKEVIRKGGETPTEEPPLPSNWDEVVEWCEKTYSDAVAFTPNARRMARSAPVYEDVGLVTRAITWLATQHRDIRLNGGGSLRDFPLGNGIINANCGGDTYSADWKGGRYDVDWHIKNGGNSHDPKRCLRIYYFWEPDLQIAVIDYLPEHRRTSAT